MKYLKRVSLSVILLATVIFNLADGTSMIGLFCLSTWLAGVVLRK